MELAKIKQQIIENNMQDKDILLVTEDTGILYYPIAIYGAAIYAFKEVGHLNELAATFNNLKGKDFISHIDHPDYMPKFTDWLVFGDYVMAEIFFTDDGPAFYLNRMP